FMRLSGSMRHNDGFAERVIDGERLGTSNDVSGRPALRRVASDSFEALLSADVTRRRATIAAHGAVIVVPSPACNQFFLDTGLDVMDFGPSSDPRKINTTGVRPDDDLNVVGTSATLTWQADNFEIKSISAYREMDQLAAVDFDGTQ